MSDKGHIATEESVASTPTIVEKDAPNENKVVLERHSPEKVKEENTNGTNRLTETKTESPKNLSKTTASIDKTSKSSKYKSENEEDTESDLEPQKKKIKRANTGSAAKKKASNTSRKRKGTHRAQKRPSSCRNHLYSSRITDSWKCRSVRYT